MQQHFFLETNDPVDKFDESGKIGVDENGKAIELYHIDQTMDSPYAELPWDEHRGKGQHGTMHDLTKKSEIDRPVFGEQKKAILDRTCTNYRRKYVIRRNYYE